jgi:hypothetical protein
MLYRIIKKIPKTIKHHKYQNESLGGGFFILPKYINLCFNFWNNKFFSNFFN